MKTHTLKHWITRCFVLIIIFSALSISIWDFHENYAANYESRNHRAIVCAQVIDRLLDHVNLKELTSASDPEYQYVRGILHQLCVSFGMDYLYVFTIDPETQYRHYIFCTANDEVLEEVVKRDRFLGAISKESLDPEEILIMNGETEAQKSEINNKFGHEVTWLVPYLTEDDELIAIIGIDFNIKRGNIKIITDFWIDIVPLILPLVFGMIVLLSLVHVRISIPLTKISVNMIRFAHDVRKKPESLSIKRNDEIGKIARTFDKMADDIGNYINNIETLTKERVENKVQLEIARRIQYGLVPENTEINSKSFSVCAVTKPAKAVGGDFYDCFQRDEDNLCIMIGDVSEKGVSAAIFMSMVKTMIREKLMAGCTPAEALNYANDEMYAQNPEGLFATVFAAVLNSKTGELCYSNAGHTQPVLLKENSEFLEMESGIALGLFEDSDLKNYTIQLSENEGILLYTDGITEAHDTNNVFFGTSRLLESVKNSSLNSENVSGTVNEVLQSVQNFFAGTEQFDDMAILAAYFKPHAEDNTQNLPVELSSLDAIKKSVFGTLGETAFARKVMLACDEVLANIVNYSKATKLTFSCEKKDSGFSVIFSDDGIPFDSTAENAPEKEFDMLDTGGMGLNVIRQTVSEMTYERKDEWNVLTLRFDFAADS